MNKEPRRTGHGTAPLTITLTTPIHTVVTAGAGRAWVFPHETHYPRNSRKPLSSGIMPVFATYALPA